MAAKSDCELNELLNVLKKHYIEEFGSDRGLSLALCAALSKMDAENRERFIRIRTEHLDSFSMAKLLAIVYAGESSDKKEAERLDCVINSGRGSGRRPTGKH